MVRFYIAQIQLFKVFGGCLLIYKMEKSKGGRMKARWGTDPQLMLDVSTFQVLEMDECQRYAMDDIHIRWCLARKRKEDASLRNKH